MSTHRFSTAKRRTTNPYGAEWRRQCALAKQHKPWVCVGRGGCGRAIPRDAVSPHPLSWSGGHPDNAPARTSRRVPSWQAINPQHRACNLKQGARDGNAQQQQRTIAVRGTSTDW